MDTASFEMSLSRVPQCRQQPCPLLRPVALPCVPQVHRCAISKHSCTLPALFHPSPPPQSCTCSRTSPPLRMQGTASRIAGAGFQQLGADAVSACMRSSLADAHWPLMPCRWSCCSGGHQASRHACTQSKLGSPFGQLPSPSAVAAHTLRRHSIAALVLSLATLLVLTPRRLPSMLAVEVAQQRVQCARAGGGHRRCARHPSPRCACVSKFVSYNHLCALRTGKGQAPVLGTKPALIQR